MVAPPPKPHRPSANQRDTGSRVKAVLGPTNTGKTHLAIERLCAHSSGAIGFPLRLLAREVYDRVCAMKGANRVALITGEERIEPKDARWLLCTAEAMPVGADLSFVALDEAQLGADRERGHLFTDRLLHARGRDETMILGSEALAPMVRALVPEAEIVTRPRFSTLSHSGARKLSRVPPRSAIVAFSAEQVYAVAEMLRRFRGGAAVVMGALSPETRNKQVALYQSGEVDYLVATDAIGMGLNLDIGHVAFAGLSKFDGQRQRRLTTAEMAQIAGRAGRHQRDGTFGTLSGTGGHDAEFTADEVFAIEGHRFPPLARLFWREPEPRCTSLATLIGDLERLPDRAELAAAPEGIDLAVLKRLAEDAGVVASLRGESQVRRFWDVCRLPDFRHHGAETHARFIARLWQDLGHGALGSDYIARAISDLDNPAGDIDTLQSRIAAIRSWAYIAQRPDWVIAREEMAARARAAETRLSDALHARLTERFVNRRTSVLMRKLGPDAALLPVTLDGDDRTVLVDGEAIGSLQGFRFAVAPETRLADRKLLLAAAERHVPALLTSRAAQLVAAIAEGTACLRVDGPSILWQNAVIAAVQAGRSLSDLRIALDPVLMALPLSARAPVHDALETWLAARLAVLAPLRQIERASMDPAAGPDLRALLIRLTENGGVIERSGSGIDLLDRVQREALRRCGVRPGVLDLYVPVLLKPGALDALALVLAARGRSHTKPLAVMPPVLALASTRPLPPGYRRLGPQALRIDLADRLLTAAHRARGAALRRAAWIDPAMAISMGLSPAGHAMLLRQAGFRAGPVRPLPPQAFGPPAPVRWRWHPPRREAEQPPRHPIRPANAFARLAELVG